MRWGLLWPEVPLHTAEAHFSKQSDNIKNRDTSLFVLISGSAVRAEILKSDHHNIGCGIGPQATLVVDKS